MKKIIPLLLLLCGLAAAKTGFASSGGGYGIITGSVVNAKGQPLIASVLVKGSTAGTFCDAEGKFSIQVTGAQTLIVSAVGYKTTEVNASGEDNTITVTLQEDAL